VALVMVHQSGGHIGSQADVEICSRIDALENVDKPSRAAHGSQQRKSGASLIGAETLDFCRED